MILIVFTIALAALSLNWAAIYGASRFGLLAIPDSRRRHQSAVPLSGGIAIFVTVLFGTFTLGIKPYTGNILAITTLVFIVGVFDDRAHINAAIRLAIQYVSGILLATYGGIVIHNVGNLLGFGDIPLLLLSVPLTALAVAGLSNAYNMIDGIDGLAASTILLPLLILLALAQAGGHPMAPALLLLVVPLFVFLVFNLGPNNRLLPKIFLGEAGSITLGFLVTASLVYFSQGDNALIRPGTALWLVTVPIMDMLATMLQRFRRGDNPLVADRSHLHHTLMNRGLSTRKTLVVIVTYATACAFTGLALEALPEKLSLLLFFLLFFAHCAFVIFSDRKTRACTRAPGV